jgi:hypothetical protein
MRDELGIPVGCTIVAPIILGYPERIPAAPKRKAPEILKIVAACAKEPKASGLQKGKPK